MTHSFDPNAPAGSEAGVFGLDVAPDAARVHLLPVPFEATTSYRRGTARGPEAILAASHQVDLFDLWTGRPYEAGIWMAPVEERVADWNEEACVLAEPILECGGDVAGNAELAAAQAHVDAIQGELNDWLYSEVAGRLAQDKLVGVVGGDHSTPFGSIRAHAERYPGLGLFHVDAHADLRPAYEGFRWSHASILHNVLEELPDVGPIVQVGIRDLCEEEYERIQAEPDRLHTLFDRTWVASKFGLDGAAPPLELIRRTIEPLPHEVYVTFDVDGLDPSLCPNTGTPVPGGFLWDEAMLWLEELVASGRRIVGFDLNEVAPARGSNGAGYDEIVGARLLYRLVGFALASQESASS